MILQSGDYRSAKKSLFGHANVVLSSGVGRDFLLCHIGRHVGNTSAGEIFCQGRHCVMDGMMLRAAAGERTGIVLDPRTKLILLFTVTTLMFSMSNEELMNIVKPVLSLMPFGLILSKQRLHMTGKYCFSMQGVSCWNRWRSLGQKDFCLFSFWQGHLRQDPLCPRDHDGPYLVSSTTVSEFVAAMERMHISDKLVISLSVIFRFFPTVREEYGAIRDAMKMRGIRFGGEKPFLMVEYRLIPLMVSVVKIGDELSDAALTRGQGGPVKCMNIYRIGFLRQDILAMLFCAGCFVAFLCQSFR